jgi:hypothetical protein
MNKSIMCIALFAIIAVSFLIFRLPSVSGSEVIGFCTDLGSKSFDCRINEGLTNLVVKEIGVNSNSQRYAIVNAFDGLIEATYTLYAGNIVNMGKVDGSSFELFVVSVDEDSVSFGPAENYGILVDFPARFCADLGSKSFDCKLNEGLTNLVVKEIGVNANSQRYAIVNAFDDLIEATYTLYAGNIVNIGKVDGSSFDLYVVSVDEDSVSFGQAESNERKVVNYEQVTDMNESNNDEIQINTSNNISTFKIAFVILGRSQADVSVENFNKVNEIKEEFRRNFEYATYGLATADVSYPVKIIIDDGNLMNPEKTEFFRDMIGAKFLETNPDEFDFIIAFADFRKDASSQMDSLTVYSDVLGIGKDYAVRTDLKTDIYKYENEGLKTNRLRSIVYWSTPVELEFLNIDSSSGLLHEIGHHWGVFVGSDFSAGKLVDLGISTLRNGADERYSINILSESNVEFIFYSLKNSSKKYFFVQIGEDFVVPKGFFNNERAYNFKLQEINLQDNSVTVATYLIPSSIEIKQDNMHFYPGLESSYLTGTPMNSHHWIANGDGTYRRVYDETIRLRYHPFQLYFMGLFTRDNFDFNKKFWTYDAGTASLGYNFENATPYKQVSINDIIAETGERKVVSFDDVSSVGLTDEISLNGISCSDGCLINETCLPYGYRLSELFCSREGMIIQKAVGTKCENNFECSSNLCADSKCTKRGIWKRIKNWLSGLG